MNNELDDMKQIWQNSPQPDATLEARQIQAMLTAQSKDALQGLRKSLIIEAVLALGVIGVLIRLAVQADTISERLAAIQLALLITPCFIFYSIGLKSVQKGISYRGNILESLREAVAFWQRLLRIYFWGGVLLLPIVMLAAGWYRVSRDGIGLDQLYVFSGGLGAVLLKVAFLCTLASVVVWVLIRVTYGVYVRKLKGCLKEMEQQEI